MKISHRWLGALLALSLAPGCVLEARGRYSTVPPPRAQVGVVVTQPAPPPPQGGVYVTPPQGGVVVTQPAQPPPPPPPRGGVVVTPPQGGVVVTQPAQPPPPPRGGVVVTPPQGGVVVTQPAQPPPPPPRGGVVVTPPQGGVVVTQPAQPPPPPPGVRGGVVVSPTQPSPPDVRGNIVVAPPQGGVVVTPNPGAPTVQAGAGPRQGAPVQAPQMPAPNTPAQPVQPVQPPSVSGGVRIGVGGGVTAPQQNIPQQPNQAQVAVTCRLLGPGTGLRGGMMTIQGSGFGQTTVYIGTSIAAIQQQSGTEIVFQVPNNSPGGDVFVEAYGQRVNCGSFRAL